MKELEKRGLKVTWLTHTTWEERDRLFPDDGTPDPHKELRRRMIDRVLAETPELYNDPYKLAAEVDRLASEEAGHTVSISGLKKPTVTDGAA